jgi:hypothetical protein
LNGSEFGSLSWGALPAFSDKLPKIVIRDLKRLFWPPALLHRGSNLRVNKQVRTAQELRWPDLRRTTSDLTSEKG